MGLEVVFSIVGTGLMVLVFVWWHKKTKHRKSKKFGEGLFQ
jgi:hypothetical protein